MLPEFTKKFLHRIAKSKQFSDYKIETQTGSNHGDNFIGNLIAVEISGGNQNDKSPNDHLSLMCKIEPCHEGRNELFDTNLMFEREIYMYSKVLPEFDRFQQERGLDKVDSFRSFPEVYVCELDDESKKYVLIMEDMRAKRYVMWPKQDIISIDHVLLVMQELGKFHAISFAMKDQRPNEFKDFSGISDPFVQMELLPWKLWFVEALEMARDVLINPVHQKIMQNLMDNVEAFYKLLFLNGPLNNEFAVVGHGDFWNNNYLFKYADEKVSFKFDPQFNQAKNLNFFLYYRYRKRVSQRKSAFWIGKWDIMVQ